MNFSKKVVIFGGTGFLGTHLIQKLIEKRYSVVVFHRRKRIERKPYVTYVSWQWDNINQIKEHIENSYVVINLTGESISKRWSKKNIDKIIHSRLYSTGNIVEAINNCQNPPQVLIQASAVGYYGYQTQQACNENTPSGKGLLAMVCNKWEEKTNNLRKEVRLVLLRTGIVLSDKYGILPKIVNPIKYFAGAIVGSGKQVIPWIHINDYVNAVIFLLENNNFAGPFNIVAPNNCNMNDLVRTSAKILKRPVFLKIPDFVIRMLFGESRANELLLASQMVVPQKLIEAQFAWQYNDIHSALNNLLLKNKYSTNL